MSGVERLATLSSPKCVSVAVSGMRAGECFSHGRDRGREGGEGGREGNWGVLGGEGRWGRWEGGVGRRGGERG